MSNKTKNCTGWCAPTIIYLALSAIGIVMTYIDPQNPAALKTLGTQVLLVAIWTALLYWLCLKCYNTAAWFLLLLPVILGVLLVFAAALIIKKL